MGLRGPKEQPANVHLLHGNPSKKPIHELLGGVHPAVEIPDCPPHLQDEARKEYERITSELFELRLISQIDRGAICGYCSAWAEVVYCETKIAEKNRNDPKGEAGYVLKTPSGYEQKSIWAQGRDRAYEKMMRFGAEFGMSPSSRSKASPSENQPVQQNLEGFEQPESAKKEGWDSV